MTRPHFILISGWAHGEEVLVPVSAVLSRAGRVSSLSAGGLMVEAKEKNLAPEGANGISLFARALTHRIRESEEPVCLIGWSLGGMVAIEAAAASPEAICGLVLVSTTARFCSSDDYAPGTPPAVLRAMRQNLPVNPEAVLADFFTRAALPRSTSRDELLDKTGKALSFGTESLAQGLRHLQFTDLRDCLGGIARPCLVIHGKKDRIVPWRAAEYLGRNLSHSAVDLIADAGHAIIEQNPEELIRRILTFLEGLP